MVGRGDIRQSTLKDAVVLEGTGVHGGKSATITLLPADPDTGICFVRSDTDARQMAATADSVGATQLCTALGAGAGCVATIEHLMAALRAMAIDNVLVEVEGGEVPILDGSAQPFVEAIESVGRATSTRPRRFIKILRPVTVVEGASRAELGVHDGFFLDVEIDFDEPLIGRQRFAAELTPAVFRKDLARARTFGFLNDVEGLWKRGLALGASLENAVVIGDGRVLNPEGLRFRDEFVRHKALDAIGDLALAGAPILGSYRSFRGGHKLNVAAVAALLGQPDAWTFVEAAPRPPVHAELPAGVAMPAYGPETS